MALAKIKHRPQCKGLAKAVTSARRRLPRRAPRKYRAFCLHLRSGVRQENRQIVGDYNASINLRGFLTMQNYQGSVIAYTNATGTLNDLYKYGPYGEPKNISNADSWTGSRFRYTGQVRLDSGELYYYKARIYDPKHGRFLQTDPVGSKDDLDLYAYTGNDPVNKSDPSGNYVETAWDAANAAWGWSDTINEARKGNVWGAVGAGLGATVDTAAVFVPFVPGGATSARRAGMAAYQAYQRADNVANATRLMRQLTAETIAKGHAWGKHGSEFADMGIKTQKQFQNYIEKTIAKADDIRVTKDGRTFYLDHQNQSVIIRDPKSEGMAFRPENWKEYITENVPARKKP